MTTEPDAEAAAMRTCLEAFDESSEAGYKLIRAALSSDAGEKVLDVVRAAQEAQEARDNLIRHVEGGPTTDSEMRYSIASDNLRTTLSALGWRP